MASSVAFFTAPPSAQIRSSLISLNNCTVGKVYLPYSKNLTEYADTNTCYAGGSVFCSTLVLVANGGPAQV